METAKFIIPIANTDTSCSIGGTQQDLDFEPDV
jgi:hypothetical protein